MNTNLSNDQILEVRPTHVYSVLNSLGLLFLSFVFLSGAFFLVKTHIPHFNSLLAALGAISLGRSIYKYFYLRCTIFLISTDQIKTVTGIFSRRVDFLELYRVKDYIVNQSFLFRLLNIMTFTLLSIDKNSQNKVIEMRGIAVSILPDKIRDLVQVARYKNRVFEVDNGSF